MSILTTLRTIAEGIGIGGEVLMRAGLVPGWKPLSISGHAVDIEDEWTSLSANIERLAYPSAAAPVSVVSDSEEDKPGESGASLIQIVGLDQDFKMITEVVTLNGQNKVITTKSFYRINGLFVITAGDSEIANDGTIYVGPEDAEYDDGEPEDPMMVYHDMMPNIGMSRTGTYTLEWPYRGYLININYSANPDKEPVLLSLEYRLPIAGSPWVKDITYLDTGVAHHPIPVGPWVMPGTDIRMRVKTEKKEADLSVFLHARLERVPDDKAPIPPSL